MTLSFCRAIWAALLMLTGWSAVSTAWAETVSIQARYRPDQADFVDIHPPRGLCVEYAYFCVGVWKSFGVALPTEFTKHTIHGTAEPRDQFYLALPPPTSVTVTHDRSGERQQVTLSFVAIGQRVFAPVDAHPAYSRMIGACSVLGMREGVDHIVIGWWYPSLQPCYTTGGLPWGGEADSRSDNMEAIVRLQTPAPHRMKHGTWRGRVAFSIGNGGQIDLGNRATVTRAPLLEFEIELDVVHAFVIDFPPDSDKAILEPPGGWVSYEQGARVPRRLSRVQPFRLWSSGPFKVYTECQRSMGTVCGLQDRRSGHQVPFSVALTLPPAHRYNGAPVRDLVLPVGQDKALGFDSSGPSFDRRGALRYEVSGEAPIAEMLRHAGATYTGVVWIIFDAQL